MVEVSAMSFCELSEKRLPRADHHEAMKDMKKSVRVLLFGKPYEMRISSVFSKCENPLFPRIRTPSCPSWLHGDLLLASALHSFRQTSTTRCHEGHEEERECSTFSANPARCASRQSVQNVRTHSSQKLEPLHALHGFM